LRANPLPSGFTSFSNYSNKDKTVVPGIGNSPRCGTLFSGDELLKLIQGI